MEEAPERKTFKFGNPNAHDVILEVGNADFHLNKGVLSAQSDFFYLLFNSDFKEKNEERVKIEADVDAFENLMEIIFKFRVKTNFTCPEGHTCGVDCDYSHPRKCHMPSILKTYKIKWAKAVWNETVNSLELVERYQMTDVKDIFVKRFIESQSVCKRKNCVNCALKIFLAHICKIPRTTSSPKFTPFTVKNLFEWYSDVIGEFTMNDAPSRNVFKYGYEGSQDVVLEVRDADKGALAVQSHFFYALFNSDFKEKNEDRVKIAADVDAFECLMEMIFNLRFKKSVACPPGGHICGLRGDCSFAKYESMTLENCRGHLTKSLRKQMISTLELAELFQMDNVKKMISDRLKESNCGKENCVNCALKLFLRCVCKMISTSTGIVPLFCEQAEDMKITKFAFTRLFDWYSNVMDDFMINGQYMKKFIKMVRFE